MSSENELSAGVLKRFLSYVRFWTTSEPHRDAIPSTPGQWDLAKALAQELRDMGVATVTLTDHCYVIARLSATPGQEARPTVAFMAHLDTASDVSGKDVKAQLVEAYDGKRIELADGMALEPALDADLAAQQGKAIIHTDGKTLLGADDKAGIAEIMSAVDYVLRHPELEHGPVEVFFTPDEEVGSGLAGFPLETVKARACYTLDGGALGEIETECFNAVSASVEFTGQAMHMGKARGRMVNPTVMAAAFVMMLPRVESPEATDGYYGYYCPMNIKADMENASLEVYIRDFDRERADQRVAALYCFANAVRAAFPGGTVTVKTTQQYVNMKEKIDEQPEVLALLQKAVDNVKIAWKQKPIRGGTDGARLTQMGIPTPNIFTGGRNAHSRLEWASVSDMTAACQVVIELIKLWRYEV
ncbi:MAG: peptidase T [Treponema sp.]|jgi:tripeptide aminopeptidase|nr:peptidase T [Treponema sp.]